MLIDQSLFGYDDGHRLLSSSVRLETDILSHLTRLSDLAPGAVFGTSDGYWTGFPIPSMRRYLLMKTWPAPEMSRPGCVWTHGLFIPADVFNFVSDLSSFVIAARRPLGAQERDRYAQPLELDTALTPGDRNRYYDTNRAADLLLKIYRKESGPMEIDKPGELDQLIFAVWSQQWPRLRRNFRFRTAAHKGLNSVSRVRFDIAFALKGSRQVTEELRPKVADDTEWLRTAITDLNSSLGTPFREFVWNYGVDVDRQIASFQPLARLYVMKERSTSNKPNGDEVVQLIADSFPNESDARLLKQSIVDGDEFTSLQCDILKNLLISSSKLSFPLPTESGIKSIRRNWIDRKRDVLELAELALRTESEIAPPLVQMLSSLISVDEFWRLTSESVSVRNRIIEARPELLDSDEIVSLTSDVILDLTANIPVDASYLSAVLARLFKIDNLTVAEGVVRRFTFQAILQMLRQLEENSYEQTARAWKMQLWAYPQILLSSSMFCHIYKASTLYRIAEGLNWSRAVAVQGGTEPWAVALKQIQADISDRDALSLHCFLLGLAITTGDRSSETIFENSFEPVHRTIMFSFLPWQAKEILDPVLPDLGWLKEWDRALKLRIAVAQTYVKHDLSDQSLRKLSSDPQTTLLLAEALEDVRAGN